ncbi:MAG: branched-chain amino acid aminotransferase [Nonomuraea sp.]|nr:branched-chain amino acid aminotransferase [Nonomuraea sp.]
MELKNHSFDTSSTTRPQSADAGRDRGLRVSEYGAAQGCGFWRARSWSARNLPSRSKRRALPDDRVRDLLRAAVRTGPADLSLTATVYTSAGEFTAADAEPEVLVRTGPAAYGPAGPLALAVVPYERVLPEVKHVGEVAKTYHLRRAVEGGFDDAAFVDRLGRLSEATIWNLAFWDGTSVVWPRAEMLAGTTMGIVRRQLDRLGIPQRVQPIRPGDLPELAGAAVMNSWTPSVPVRGIGSAAFPEAPAFHELLHRAYEAEPLVAP